MVSGSDRYCDGCGQRLPTGAKLSQQIMAKGEGLRLNPQAEENADGSVTVDLCLDCRIRRAEWAKRQEAGA